MMILAFSRATDAIVSESMYSHEDEETRTRAAAQLLSALNYLERHTHAHSVPARMFFGPMTDEQELDLLMFLVDGNRQIVLCHDFLAEDEEEVGRGLRSIGLQYPFALRVARGLFLGLTDADIVAQAPIPDC
jgi:hypothetical protein